MSKAKKKYKKIKEGNPLTPEDKAGLLFDYAKHLTTKEKLMEKFGVTTKKGVIKWYRDHPNHEGY